MNIGSTIEPVMREDFLRLSPATPIREAAAAFARMGLAAAPVLDDAGVLVGILTEKDCLRPMLNASYYQQWEGSVADVMSREVRALIADLDPVSAAEEFLTRSHRVYPVMRDGVVVGLLHRSDLFAAILALSESR
jgi:CBS domain-containing protein